jgi:hypothetical protein
MEIIPQLISRYSIVLFAVCAIACAYFVFTGVASLRELRRAVFRLERNAVVSRAISALLKAFLCVIIGLAIYAVTTIAPAPRTSLLAGSATGTPSGIVIPTSMPTAVITSGQALMTVSFTPTITFVGTTTAVSNSAQAAIAQAPTLSLEMMADCTNPKAQITNPAPGEHVTGVYTVRGTAVLDSGSWYKLEILLPGASQYAQLGRGEVTVNGNALFANFNTGSLAPGVYPFRLVIVGADGNARAFCRIPITIG